MCKAKHRESTWLLKRYLHWSATQEASKSLPQYALHAPYIHAFHGRMYHYIPTDGIPIGRSTADRWSAKSPGLAGKLSCFFFAKGINAASHAAARSCKPRRRAWGSCGQSADAISNGAQDPLPRSSDARPVPKERRALEASRPPSRSPGAAGQTKPRTRHRTSRPCQL